MQRLLQRSLVLWVFFLSACAGPQLSQQSTSAEVEKSGTLVLSVTHDYDTGIRAMATVVIGRVAGEKNEDVRLLKSLRDAMGIRTRGDYENGYGQVYVLTVQPGRYRLISWSTKSGYAILTPKDRPPQYEFEVGPGEIIYLGSINVIHAQGKSIIGFPVVADALPQILDRSIEDVGIAETKAPVIRGLVKKRLLPQGWWYFGKPETQRAIEMPPITPSPVPQRR